MNLNISSWGNFKISELFPVLQNGKANQGMLSDGYDCFYVGAKKDDNEVLTEEYPTKLVRLGIHDTFGKSGKAEKLMEHFRITEKEIIYKVEKEFHI